MDVGQTVAASMQAPTLFVLAADLTKMQVVANLDESDVGRIRPGQRVTFRVDAYPAEDFNGTVAQVRLQPIVQQNVVTYATVIDVPNPELKLKPGMTANVNVEIARADRRDARAERGAALPADATRCSRRSGMTPPEPGQAGEPGDRPRTRQHQVRKVLGAHRVRRALKAHRALRRSRCARSHQVARAVHRPHRRSAAAGEGACTQAVRRSRAGWPSGCRT